MKICLSIAKRDKEFEGMIKTLSQFAEVEVVGLSDYSLVDVDIFIGKRMSKTALKTANKLKAVFAYKTGVDDFPLAEMEKRGIILVNSHVDAGIIAEYAFGLSISLVNRITECDKKLRRGIWYDHTNPFWESFFNMRVGLLGFGHIGKNINAILKRNGIKAYTLNRGKTVEDIEVVDSLEELFKNSDLVILSLPKTANTDNVINEDTIKLLKGKYIVNVGRSNSIDQKALYDALKNKYVAGAAIDTWDKKPSGKQILPPSDQPFTELENIVLSPHQAIKTKEGHQRYVKDITQKVIDYINTGEVTDKIDYKKGY